MYVGVLEEQVVQTHLLEILSRPVGIDLAS